MVSIVSRCRSLEAMASTFVPLSGSGLSVLLNSFTTLTTGVLRKLARFTYCHGGEFALANFAFTASLINELCWLVDRFGA